MKNVILSILLLIGAVSCTPRTPESPRELTREQRDSSMVYQMMRADSMLDPIINRLDSTAYGKYETARELTEWNDSHEGQAFKALNNKVDSLMSVILKLK